MNSSFDSATSAAQRFASIPLRLLASLDYQVLKLEYRNLVEQSTAHNAWFVHREGETIGPETIEAILHRLANGESSLAIIPAQSLADSDPEWQILNHQSWRDDRGVAVVWVVCFWMLAVLLGWTLIGLIWPLSLRRFCEVVYFLALLIASIRLVLTPRRSGSLVDPHDTVIIS